MEMNHQIVADLKSLGVREGMIAQMGLSATHVCIPFAASGTGANEAVLAGVHGTLAVVVSGHYSTRLADMGERLGPT